MAHGAWFQITINPNILSSENTESLELNKGLIKFYVQ